MNGPMKYRLLIITPYLPYPLNSGGNSAQYRLLKSLVNYCDITLCTEGTNQNLKGLPGLKASLPSINYQIVSQPFFKRWFLQFKSLVWKLLIPIYKRLFKSTNTSNTFQSQIGKALNSAISRELSSFLSSQDLSYYHCIQVEFFEYLNAIEVLANHSNVVFIHHEVRFEVIRKQAISLRIQQQTIQDFIQPIISHEISLLNRYRELVVFSESDKETLLYNGLGINARVIPIPYIAPSPLPSVQTNTKPHLVFLGGYNHFPNFDGLKYFHDEVWPIIRKQRPELSLNVIGNWPSVVQKTFQGNANFVFTGFIENLSDQLFNSILIVPIRIGSGIRIKILDAISSGAAVITTQAGLEGIPLKHNVDCLIAETPTDFLQAINILLSNPQYLTTLVNSAQKTLENELNIDRIINARLSIIANQE